MNDLVSTLGNVGEFIGSIGVLITLIYLSIQVRQNTQQLRIEAANQALRDFYELTNNNERYERCLTSLMAGQPLTPADRIHVVQRFAVVLLTLQNLLYRHSQGGHLDVEQLALDTLKWAVTAEACQAMWPMIKEEFEPWFQDIVDAKILAQMDEPSNFGSMYAYLETAHDGRDA